MASRQHGRRGTRRDQRASLLGGARIARDETDRQALLEAMKGMSWESPRGPVSIDPETRDIVQNVYIREVKEVGGHLYNVEFDRLENVKDSAKAAS